MKKFLIKFTITLGLLTCLSPLSYAAGISIPKPDTLPGPAQEIDINGNTIALDADTYLTNRLIPTIVSNLSGILGAVSLFFLIYGGIQYLTVYNQDDRASNAKETIKWALIGLLVGILSYSIVNIIGYLDGLQGSQTPQTIQVELQQ